MWRAGSAPAVPVINEAAGLHVADSGVLIQLVVANRYRVEGDGSQQRREALSVDWRKVGDARAVHYVAGIEQPQVLALLPRAPADARAVRNRGADQGGRARRTAVSPEPARRADGVMGRGVWTWIRYWS